MLGLFVVVIIASFVVGSAVAANRDESLERRSRFWVRVVLFAVIPLAGLAGLALLAAGAMWPFFILLAALVVYPAALFRRSRSAAGPCEDGGHGGSGPDQPPSPPNAPRDGGIPLADSEQALARVRDHTGPRWHPKRSLRRSRDPERAAVETPQRI